MKRIGLLFLFISIGCVVYCYPVVREFQQISADNGPTLGLIIRILLMLFSSLYVAVYLGAIIANLLGRAVVDLLFHVHGGPPIDPKNKDQESEAQSEEKELEEREE